MMGLIPRPEAPEDLDRLGHGRLIDVDLLEPALQGRVPLDIFPVFIGGGRSDALDQTGGERRFQDGGGVEGPLRTPGPDHCMELVDEEDHIPGLDHLIDQGLEPLLELPAVFGPRDHRGHVQFDDLLVLEDEGDIPGGDFLRQALDDCCLSHPGFADQCGVVFLPPGEGLDDLIDLLIPTDHGIESPCTGFLHQAPAEFEPLPAPLLPPESGPEERLPLTPALGQEGVDLRGIDSVTVEELGPEALALFEDRQEEVLRCDQALALTARLLIGEVEDLLQLGVRPEFPRDEGAPASAEAGLQLPCDLEVGDPMPLEELMDRRPTDLEQSEKEMLHPDIAVLPCAGLVIGGPHNLLGLP